MRRALIVTVAAGLMVAADAPADAVKKELEKFQGEWVMVSSERDGKKLPEEQVKLVRRVVKGEAYTLLRDGKEAGKGKIRVDPSKTPKTIEAVRMEGTKDKPMLGIYEWEGDNQKVCFAPPGKPRPTEFSSKPGSGNLLSVWKRAK